MRRRLVLAAALGLAPLTLVACGGGDPAVEASVGLPDVAVLELSSGEEVALGSYLPSDRPLLVWMWAPY